MIAIIPARGGSKGLKDKNTRLLGGIPLISHSIKAALDSNLVSRVIVSTDDAEISSIAKDFGAEVPFIRPGYLASDSSKIIDTYLHVIDMLSDEISKEIKSFVALLPTVPLRNSKDIDNAINIFEKQKADSVISVVKSTTPIDWNLIIDNKNILRAFFPKSSLLKNRQEEKVSYIPNGAIYIFRTHILRSVRNYYTEKTFPYVMPRERSVDIDDLLDFEWAEYLFNK